MVAVELYREAFRDLLNSNEHENSNTAVHVGEFILSFLFPYVREISVTDVVFCLTRTGACPREACGPEAPPSFPWTPTTTGYPRCVRFVPRQGAAQW